MKYKLSKHAVDAMSIRSIELEWIEAVIGSPSFYRKISTTEEHFFGLIAPENRCLKVAVNPTTNTIITIYFDRNMRKKGCKDEDKI